MAHTKMEMATITAMLAGPTLKNVHYSDYAKVIGSFADAAELLLDNCEEHSEIEEPERNAGSSEENPLV